MKLFGVGVLTAPGSSRVVWDFIDGTFDTCNSELIRYALKNGFVEYKEEETKSVEKPRRGRPKNER